MEDWTPSPDDVGSILRARTTDDAGKEQGRFTSETRPTAKDIEPLIDTVVSRILGKVGKPIPPEQHRFARRVAAAGVACKVELSYWPEQVAEGRSPYAELKVEFDEGVADLIVAAQNADNDDTTDDNVLLTYSSFDDAPILGRRTRF